MLDVVRPGGQFKIAGAGAVLGSACGMWNVLSRKGVLHMANQAAAQEARRAAREARARVRAERAAREKRLARAGETVAVELARRDAAVADHERRAGEALRTMVQDERLSVRDALGWCGVQGLTSREALRMMRRPHENGMHPGEANGARGG